MNKIDLSERVAIVTGGAQGFGLALNLGENVNPFKLMLQNLILLKELQKNQ